MVYCSNCGYKNFDDAQYCSKCGIPLNQSNKPVAKGDDCVCEVDNRNPFTPIFWGLTIILIGLWIIYNYALPKTLLPSWLQNIDFCNIIFLIIAIAIILTGLRKITR